MDIRELAVKTLDSISENDLAKYFLNYSDSTPCYAIGKNTESLALNAISQLDGIIDDYRGDKTHWEGIPLVGTGEVSKSAIIANCSTSIRPVDVLKHLKNEGFTKIVGLHELLKIPGLGNALPRFVESMRKEIKIHSQNWQEIYNNLSDEESKKTFLDVVRYRLSAEPAYMENYSVRIEQQYLEKFMNYRQEIFVDAGGFDGDTSESFALRYPDYKKIIFFEPSQKNMVDAKKRLKKFQRIEYHQIGLSDSSGTLNFDENAGSASSVNAKGNQSIKVDALDVLVSEPISFIKMDLEGWEIHALKGARGHIEKEKPKLAIAAYHDSSDFRVIFDYIMAIHPDYSVYLRHYTQGWSETIMYFVPKIR